MLRRPRHIYTWVYISRKNVWADTQFVKEWAERIVKLVIMDLPPFILFMGKLNSHHQKRLRQVMSNLSGLDWFGEANATDIWKPVDGGYAAALKALMNQEFFKWLDDDDENIEVWYRENIRISASDKRILITHWVGNAHRKLASLTYDVSRWQLFEKIGF